MECGIYIIKNLINNKIYVGSSQNIKRRFYLHKHYLSKKEHTNIHLQTAWDLYGEENFSFYVLQAIESKEQLCMVEKYYIDLFDATNREKGYNICHDTMAPMRDRKHSEVSIKKMIDCKTGEKNSFYGKQHTEESKSKIRNAKIGKKLSNNHKEKIKDSSHFKTGDNHIRSKLTNEQVEHIRQLYDTCSNKRNFCKLISDQYNVSYDTIRRVILKKSYNNEE